MSRRNSSSEDTPTPEREEINQPRIILCEGKADSVFLKALLSQRRLYGFQISEPAHGNRDFTRRLNAIKATEAYVTHIIRDVVLVTDNDEYPQKSFRDVKKQIQKSNTYPVPNKPYNRAIKAGVPAISVITLPGEGQRGCLEGLLLEAMAGKFKKVAKCLDEYRDCTPAKKWGVSKTQKMMLQCMIAALCEKDPSSSLVLLWSKERNMKDLLKGKRFNNLVSFLRKIKNS